MINVLLICSQGASTAIMCDRIKEAAKQNNVEMEVNAVAMAVSSDYIPKADVILLGPQVRYLKGKVVAVAGEKPVDTIEMATYGMMDGKKVFDQIMGMLK